MKVQLKLVNMGLVALMVMMAFMTSTTFVTPAHAALSRVGPVNPDTGFPAWFQDSNGLRLENCLDGPPNCLAAAGDLVAPDGEAFWWDAAPT